MIVSVSAIAIGTESGGGTMMGIRDAWAVRASCMRDDAVGVPGGIGTEGRRGRGRGIGTILMIGTDIGGEMARV